MTTHRPQLPPEHRRGARRAGAWVRVSSQRRSLAGSSGDGASLVRILVFALGLAAGGALILLLTPWGTTDPPRAWHLPLLVLAAAFAAAEATALHVEIRKESHSLSLGAIPLMFGILFVSPVDLAVAHVIGAAPVLLLVRRVGMVKTLWNSSLFVAEAALVGLVMRSALGPDLPATALEWVVPLVAVLAAELLSLVAVSIVIMLVDGRFRPNLFANVGRSQILAALGGSFTVTVSAAAISSPAMLLYGLVPVVGIGALLRSSGQLSQRFADLQKLHGFTRALTNERGARTLDTGLAHLVEIMRTRSAGLILTDGDGVGSGRALDDDRFITIGGDSDLPALGSAVADGEVVLITEQDPDPARRSVLAALGVQSVLAVKVMGEVDRVGVLYVADRLGMRHDFSADEIRLFGSLADTLSSRLSNDYLVEQLEVQAQHDALTGLPNRLSFEVALTTSLSEPGQCGAVLMLDLDRFKEINDSLGHATGDRLLVEVARRLERVIRPGDVVARFGGDEYAVVLIDRGDRSCELETLVPELHRQLVERVAVDGITFDIGASIGAARWPEDGNDSGTLLRRADSAMYEAKRNQTGVEWYRPELDADAPRRLELTHAVRAALEDGELYVELQPQVAAATGEVVGAEALVRWHHPVFGPVPPAEFVPIITQIGLTGRLTRYVLRRTVEASIALRASGIAIPVSLNLTPRDLLDPNLPGDLADILAASRLPSGSIEVEITEDAIVVDFVASSDVLQQIRGLGVRVALDDFGTGYSSLQHLHELPVDHIKIDRSFVARLSSERSAHAIVRASIGLARDLGLVTIAEGVEDDDMVARAAELGCDRLQGFAIAASMSTDRFIEWAAAWATDGMFRLAATVDRGTAPEPSGAAR